jgi:biopolymer transport protein ExbD
MFAMPDIAFLLLIFLILTVSVAEDDEIEVPKFQFTQETEFPDVVAIRVDSQGRIDVEGERRDSENLLERLLLVESGSVIHVIADGKAEYLIVDTVLDALKRAGLTDVVLIAETDDNLQ